MRRFMEKNLFSKNLEIINYELNTKKDDKI